MALWAVDKNGNRVKAAGIGVPGPAGKTAYQYAVDGGFSGTEEEFSVMLAGNSNPSLLDNCRWDRRENIVNQRGQNEYTTTTSGIAHSIDRWYVQKNMTLSIQEESIHYTNTATSYDTFGQRIERNRLPSVGAITLSFLIRGTGIIIPLLGSHMPEQSLSLGQEYEILSVTTVVENITGDIIDVGFHGGTIVDADIKAIKLELGTRQTLAHQDEGGNWVLNDPPPDKTLELAKCQRYYWKSTMVSETVNTSCFIPLYSNNNTFYFTPAINNPTTMRSVPAVKINGKGNGEIVTLRDTFTNDTVSGKITTDAFCVSKDGLIRLTLKESTGSFTMGHMYEGTIELTADL